MLFSTAYFPPVHFWAAALQSSQESITIEQWENFQKQSFRNRCQIHAANGILDLSVPIQKSIGLKQSIKDCRIGYDTDWQTLHFKSIESAYRHSPFFEFYIDDLMSFWERKETFLLDLNLKIMETLAPLLYCPFTFNYSTEFTPPNQELDFDYRYDIHPKKDWSFDQTYKPKPYYQVFDQKNGFLANLSILDTLFCLGPETRIYLINSISKT